MRSFTDAEGKAWQAALLDASYGNICLLFSPLRGNDIRQHPMPADNMAEAEEQFAGLDDDALRALLAGAGPWDPGATP